MTGTSKGRANVQLTDPAVVASVDDPDGALLPGAEISVTVAGVDVAKRSVRLEVQAPAAPAAHQS